MKRTQIERLLPGIYQRVVHPGGPLETALGVMEELHAPAEASMEGLDRSLDPRRTPDPFVPFLARWVDLAWLLEEERDPGRGAAGSARYLATRGLGQLRELIASAARLSQLRGSRAGLLQFLESATGLQGFDIDERVAGPDGQPQPFHMQIIAPAEAREPHFEDLITRIVEMEKPAYVTYEIAFGSAGPRDA